MTDLPHAPPVQVEPLLVRTRDERALTAWAFQPATPGAASVVLLGALAAPQRYLRHTARALAAAGYPTLTFDYRGVGESQPAGAPTSNLDDWAEDARAAVEACRARFAPSRILAVGHSIGGMLIGHGGLGEQVDAALLIGATHGRPPYYQGWPRARLEAAYRVLPGVARVLGELPPWGWLLGASLPRDVVRHWVRWGREGFVRWDGSPSAPAFLRLRAPLLAAAIADDDYAPLPAVDALLDQFRGAGRRRVLLDPRQHDRRQRLGHFGLFRADAPAWAQEALLGWLAELERSCARYEASG